jgi:hypothetical protein
LNEEWEISEARVNAFREYQMADMALKPEEVKAVVDDLEEMVSGGLVFTPDWAVHRSAPT